jgi:hypothetical protein
VGVLLRQLALLRMHRSPCAYHKKEHLAFRGRALQ